MRKKLSEYINSKIDRYIEESIREDSSFDKEWFKTNIKGLITELIEAEKGN